MDKRMQTLLQRKLRAKLVKKAQSMSLEEIDAAKDSMSDAEYKQLRKIKIQLKTEEEAIAREERKIAYMKRELALRKEGWKTTIDVAKQFGYPTTLARAALFDGVQSGKWQSERVGRKLWWKPSARNSDGRLEIP